MDTSAEVTKAMILAAGEGTRLRPLTLKTPKVLLPVGGIPLICHILNWLRRHGITQIAMNLHHLGDRIREFLGDGSRFAVRVIYSPEETLLGTAGGVRRMEGFFDETFVVVYGDVLADLDLRRVIGFHRDKNAVATLAAVEMSDPQGVGVMRVREDSRVIDFAEKPSTGAPRGNLVNGGIYVLEREVLEWIPRQGYCDFAYDVFPHLLDAGLPVCAYVLGSQDYLIDIGTPDKYRQANEDIDRIQLAKEGGRWARLR